MKKSNFIMTLGILTLGNLTNSAHAAEVKIKIDQISSDQGKIYAQIFKGADNYKNGNALSGLRLSAKSGPYVLTFNNLDSGEYAVRIFHDENGNGKMDTNLFGMPVEGYGFSNQARANFGPASYQDMKFTVPEGAEQVTTKANMTY